MKINLFLAVLLIAVLLAACGSGAAASPAPDNPQEPQETGMEKRPASGETRSQIGAGFTLGEGETVSIEDGRFEITLVQVLEDSRCPQDAECFWEGNARVLVRVGENEHILTLGALLEGDSASVSLGEGLSLRVVEIRPYPGSEQDGQPYQVTLVVERETSQPYYYPVGV